MIAGRLPRSLGPTAVALGVLAALHTLDVTGLATPPLSLSELSDWVAATAPIDMAMGIVRVGIEIVCWYLVVVGIVDVVATVTGAAPLHRVVRLLTAPLPRHVARLLVGVTVATATGPVAFSGDELSGPTTTMVALDGEASAALPTMTPLGTPNDELASAGPVSSQGTATGGPVRSDGFATAGPVAATPTEAPATDVAAAVDSPATWTVGPGESFWSIAEDTVSDLLGRPATDAEVAPYWGALVDANRARLVDPSDPDLILPGQVFELPTHRR